MKGLKVSLIVILIIMMSSIVTNACFVIKITSDGKVLIGNNEDWRETRTKMWFIPKTNKEYGRICFGFEPSYGFVQGGMNEKGLFLDALGLSRVEWKPVPGKKDFDGQINDHILANFSNIDEVKQFFNEYNVFLGGGKFMVADPSGRSMIIEYVKGKNRFVESTKNYQLASNVIQYGFNDEDISDPRYKIALKIVENEKKLSFKTVKKVLSAVHSEWRSTTLYSYICDLKSRKVYLYNFHNFEEEYVIDLNKELKKGKHAYDLPSLFLTDTRAAQLYEARSPKRGNETFLQVMENNGISQAFDWYHKIKDKTISTSLPLYKFVEYKLTDKGYKYFEDKKFKKAIAIFKFITTLYPDSANAWDSLAEAFMKMGDTKKAINNYKKALKLDPDNETAKKIIEKNTKKK